MFFVIHLSKNITLKMSSIGGLDMCEACIYSVINSHVFVCSCWFCSSDEPVFIFSAHPLLTFLLSIFYYLQAFRTKFCHNFDFLKKRLWNKYHNHHHLHISVMQLGHLLTRSGLTYP